tara:strand:- start:1375 stop:1890 length:516 start_codon:yes stop_codon:yes gene_type:complete
MANLEVTDGFLNPNDFSSINDAMKPGSDFSWYHHLNNLNELGPENYLRNNQHSHVFYFGGAWKSDKAPILEPVIKSINAFALVRVKANLLLYSGPELFFGGFHIDVDREDICTTAILYLDTCNGPTEFEDGEKINSVANRLVQFPANVRHGSWTATDVPYRRVINFNWIPF